jgi:hypothetical protein
MSDTATANGNGEAVEVTQAVGLYGKLAEVVAEVGVVPKSGHNDFHDYDYVLESDLLEAVRLKLSERGVLILPSVTKVERESTLTTVHVRFVIHDAESGERFEADWAGTGSDKGDKALYKAYTGALKYFLMKTLLIPTGSDPEGGKEPDAPEPSAARNLPAEKVETLKTTITEAGLDSFLEMKLRSFGVSALSDLTVDQGIAVWEWVQAERASG